MKRTPRHVASLLIALALVAPAARGQTPVATFASVAGGGVEVQRGARGEWQAALIGNPVFLGESVRTAADGGATLVFTDDCVVDLGRATTLTVERYPGTAKGHGNALLKLQQGAVEAIVSGYGDAGARFEIETPSAVARVRGTRFVVRYDPATKATDVAGLEGVVSVQGRTALIGPGVAVGADETSYVESGKFPSPVKALDAALRGQLLAGLDSVGTGERDGLDTDNPLLDGRNVPAEDRPQVSAAATKDGSYLHPAVPDDPLMYRLAPDIRANTQSLPVYEAVPPNEVPPAAP
ncbi:MAG: FecR family protein [bacterium]